MRTGRIVFFKLKRQLSVLAGAVTGVPGMPSGVRTLSVFTRMVSGG